MFCFLQKIFSRPNQRTSQLEQALVPIHRLKSNPGMNKKASGSNRQKPNGNASSRPWTLYENKLLAGPNQHLQAWHRLNKNHLCVLHCNSKDNCANIYIYSLLSIITKYDTIPAGFCVLPLLQMSICLRWTKTYLYANCNITDAEKKRMGKCWIINCCIDYD